LLNGLLPTDLIQSRIGG